MFNIIEVFVLNLITYAGGLYFPVSLFFVVVFLEIVRRSPAVAAKFLLGRRTLRFVYLLIVIVCLVPLSKDLYEGGSLSLGITSIMGLAVGFVLGGTLRISLRDLGLSLLLQVTHLGAFCGVLANVLAVLLAPRIMIDTASLFYPIGVSIGLGYWYAIADLCLKYGILFKVWFGSLKNLGRIPPVSRDFSLYEHRAIQLWSRRRYKKLKIKLMKWRGLQHGDTRILRLVEACVDRKINDPQRSASLNRAMNFEVECAHDSSEMPDQNHDRLEKIYTLQDLDRELGIPDVTEGKSDLNKKIRDRLEAHLYLYKSLGLVDSDEPEKADCLLRGLVASQHGRECPITNSLFALRSALGTLEAEKFEPSAESLKYCQRAFWLRSKVIEKGRSFDKMNRQAVEHYVLTRLANQAVPLRKGFFIEIYIICLLAANMLYDATELAERNLSLNVNSAEAFHTLGWAYWKEGERRRALNVSSSKQLFRRATLAFYASYELTGDRRSVFARNNIHRARQMEQRHASR